MTCSGAHLHSVPSRIPPNLDILVIKNASELYTISKHSFRKMDRLREIKFLYCARLETIEKFAFKGLRRLRLISFTGCPALMEIVKGAFSGILNDEGLRILFRETPIRDVYSGAFRHAHKLREVAISGSNLHLHRHSLGSINQLDFLTLSGVSQIDAQIFANSTRFYTVHVHNSDTEIPTQAFANLAHVHQILIQRSTLPMLATEAFAGLSTVETLELYDNRIGTIAPHAFSGVENVGRVRVARNIIGQVDSPESVLSTGSSQLRLEENVVRCSCALRWMGAQSDTSMVDNNHCGVEGVHRSVRDFLLSSCYGRKSEATLVNERTTSLQDPGSFLNQTSSFSCLNSNSLHILSCLTVFMSFFL